MDILKIIIFAVAISLLIFIYITSEKINKKELDKLRAAGVIHHAEYDTNLFEHRQEAELEQEKDYKKHNIENIGELDKDGIKYVDVLDQLDEIEYLPDRFDLADFGDEQQVYKKEANDKIIYYMRRPVNNSKDTSFIFYIKKQHEDGKYYVKLMKLSDLDIPDIIKQSLAIEFEMKLGFRDYEFNKSPLPTTVDSSKFKLPSAKGKKEIVEELIYNDVYTENIEDNHIVQCVLLTFEEKFLAGDIKNLLNDTLENKLPKEYLITPYTDSFAKNKYYKQFIVYEKPVEMIRFVTIYNDKKQRKEAVRIYKLQLSAKMHFGMITAASYLSHKLIKHEYFLRIGSFKDDELNPKIKDILEDHIGYGNKMRESHDKNDKYKIIDIVEMDWDKLRALMAIVGSYKHVFQVSLHSVMV